VDRGAATNLILNNYDISGQLEDKKGAEYVNVSSLVLNRKSVQEEIDEADEVKLENQW